MTLFYFNSFKHLWTGDEFKRLTKLNSVFKFLFLLTSVVWVFALFSTMFFIKPEFTTIDWVLVYGGIALVIILFVFGSVYTGQFEEATIAEAQKGDMGRNKMLKRFMKATEKKNKFISKFFVWLGVVFAFGFISFLLGFITKPESGLSDLSILGLVLIGIIIILAGLAYIAYTTVVASDFVSRFYLDLQDLKPAVTAKTIEVKEPKVKKPKAAKAKKVKAPKEEEVSTEAEERPWYEKYLTSDVNNKPAEVKESAKREISSEKEVANFDARQEEIIKKQNAQIENWEKENSKQIDISEVKAKEQEFLEKQKAQMEKRFEESSKKYTKPQTKEFAPDADGYDDAYFDSLLNSKSTPEETVFDLDGMLSSAKVNPSEIDLKNDVLQPIDDDLGDLDKMLKDLNSVKTEEKKQEDDDIEKLIAEIESGRFEIGKMGEPEAKKEPANEAIAESAEDIIREFEEKTAKELEGKLEEKAVEEYTRKEKVEKTKKTVTITQVTEEELLGPEKILEEVIKLSGQKVTAEEFVEAKASKDEFDLDEFDLDGFNKDIKKLKTQIEEETTEVKDDKTDEN